MAMRYNPILLRASARVESARGTAWQAGIPPNPRWDTNNPYIFAGNQSQYSAGFMQELVTKGKLQLDRAAAIQQVEQARLEFTEDWFGLLTAVRQQFFRVLAGERRVAALAELVDIATNSQTVAQQKRKAGTVAESDVLLLTVELQQARVALENARTQLAGAQRALAATIGVADLVIRDAVGDLAANLPDFDEEFVRGFVANQNAQVLAARREIVKNRILLRRAQVEPFPNLNIGPAIAWGPSSSSSGAPGTQAWLNFQFPIPTWNRNQGNIRAAGAEVREAIASTGALQNELLRQVADVLSRYRVARELAQRIGREILPTAVRTQRLVRSGYDSGETDISPLLQAQRTLTQVNLTYIDALEDAWTSASELAGLLQLERFP